MKGCFDKSEFVELMYVERFFERKAFPLGGRCPEGADEGEALQVLFMWQLNIAT